VPAAGVAVVLVGLLAGLLVGLLSALVMTGAAAPSLVDDPGSLTRWGLPVVRTLSDLAAALTIGLLVVAAYVLPAAGWPPDGAPARQGARSEQGRPYDDGRLGGLTLTATRLATATGTFWVLCSAAVLVLTYSSIAGTPVGGAGFTDQLARFATSIEPLRALLLSTLLVVVAVTGTALATGHSAVGWMALVALLALVPLALTGHSAGARGHELAVDALAAHLVGAWSTPSCGWAAGLGWLARTAPWWSARP